ncbi:NADPH-adrenodoxin reductase [Coemansia erecta]|nr:NADPH-adrenodoxin reductase [Coemansia erecta]
MSLIHVSSAAGFYESGLRKPGLYDQTSQGSTSSTPHDPEFRNIAVVGGGAAGFYTAARVLAKVHNVHVDIFEQLPTPHGLVRYGVAPDHPEVKNCTNKFNDVAQDARVRYFGNVKIGTGRGALAVDAMRRAYDAVVLAYGASEDRQLGIAGEGGQGDNVGVVSARQFVAWYNGLPDAQALEPDLQSHDTVVIVGHGNVALDCARILLAPVNQLAATDITSRATAVLKKSRVRRVEMVGRRGPLQVSFTTKELREMTKLTGVQIECDRDLIKSECASPAGAAYLESSRPLRRMMDLLLKHGVSLKDPRAAYSSTKHFSLRFLMSPTEVVYAGNTQRMRFQVNRLEGPPDSARAVATDAVAEIPCGMALRSIGYASTPLDGVPFDARRRIVPNIAGRVVVGDDAVRGLYVSGWIKRGPVGVIATTMQDAYRTADAIVMDLENGAIGGIASRAAVDQLLSSAGIGDVRVTNDDWKRLDAFEVTEGSARGKPREKVVSVEKMLKYIKASKK